MGNLIIKNEDDNNDAGGCNSTHEQDVGGDQMTSLVATDENEQNTLVVVENTQNMPERNCEVTVENSRHEAEMEVEVDDPVEEMEVEIAKQHQKVRSTSRGRPRRQSRSSRTRHRSCNSRPRRRSQSSRSRRQSTRGYHKNSRSTGNGSTTQRKRKKSTSSSSSFSSLEGDCRNSHTRPADRNDITVIVHNSDDEEGAKPKQRRRRRHRTLQRVTSVYHPHTNGTVKRQNRIFKNRLLKDLPKNINKWPFYEFYNEKEDTKKPNNNDAINNEETSVVSTRFTVIDEYRTFNPVGKPWQILRCKQLKLDITKFLKFPSKSGKMLSYPTVTQDISADGNCLYRSLSYFITGTEDYHMEIRKHIAIIVRTEKKIHDYVGGTDKMDIYLNANKIDCNGVWGTDVEIFAAAHFLKTSIIVYSTKTNIWQRFSKNLELKTKMYSTEKCIYIRNIGNVHYDVVLDVQ